MNKQGYEISDTTIIRYLGEEKILTIPETFDGCAVTILGEGSFAYNYKFKEVTIPKSVKSIEKLAFKNQVFTKITLNEGLVYIGEFAFVQCVFDEITLPKSLLTIDNSAFLKCRKLRKVSILNDKVSIAKNAFKYCSSLEEIDFCAWRYLDLKQLTKIVTKKFNSWNTLSDEERKQIISFIKKKKTLRKDIFLSNNIHIIQVLVDNKINLDLQDLNLYIENSIAKNFTSITAVLLDYKNKNFTNEEIKINAENKELVELGLELPTLKQFKANWICSKADGGLSVSGYKGTNIVEIIPNELACGTKIVALKGSDKNNFKPIKKLIIEANITEIPEKTFSYNNNLEEIILPETITTICEKAFKNCLKLKTFKIPPKVTNIDTETFYMCENLETVEFHNNLTQINMRAFFDCPKLSNVTLPETVTKILTSAFKYCPFLYDADRFIIFNNILCSYIGNDRVVTIPNNVKIIGSGSFSFLDSLEEVIIPDSVELIENVAFDYCKNLEKVTLSPNTVVDWIAFGNCKYKYKYKYKHKH